MIYKRFSEISEISDENEKQRYKDFGQLNKLIETQGFTREQISKAYEEVLLGELPLPNYTELHFQIKYLLDQVKVSLNSILNFYDYKITTYISRCIELINNDIDLNIPDKAKKIIIDYLTGKQTDKIIELKIVGFDNKIKDTFLIDLINGNDENAYKSLISWRSKLKKYGEEGVSVFAGFRLFKYTN